MRITSRVDGVCCCCSGLLRLHSNCECCSRHLQAGNDAVVWAREVEAEYGIHRWLSERESSLSGDENVVFETAGLPKGRCWSIDFVLKSYTDWSVKNGRGSSALSMLKDLKRPEASYEISFCSF